MYSYTCAVMTDTILIIKGKLSNVDFAQIIIFIIVRLAVH